MEVSMHSLRTLLAGSLVLAIALSSSAYGQDRHAVDRTTLADAVSQHVDKQEAGRAAIREALGRPAVRDAASKAGIDVDRLSAGVETMAGADLERAAAAARDVNQSLVGGASNITISTTTIIIALLVIILLIVAIR